MNNPKTDNEIKHEMISHWAKYFLEELDTMIQEDQNDSSSNSF